MTCPEQRGCGLSRKAVLFPLTVLISLCNSAIVAEEIVGQREVPAVAVSASGGQGWGLTSVNLILKLFHLL